MEKEIKEILTNLNNHNFSSYLVGGYVRDYLLNNKSFDIDICTNARPEDIKNIFNNFDLKENYGSINFSYHNYNIDITTFREELIYEKRKPIKIVYLNKLEDDLKRRDFTINAICMDINENIIDIYNGINDLNNKKIKIIGNIDNKLKEDPLRILRAIRFASILDFNLDEELEENIKINYKLVKSLSDYRIKEELSKILINKNYLKGLSLLKKFKILDLLDITYNDTKYINDLDTMWAQLEFTHNYGFTKKEFNNIINIRQHLKNNNEKR